VTPAAAHVSEAPVATEKRVEQAPHGLRMSIPQ
jgi:hypothetical protein